MIAEAPRSAASRLAGSSYEILATLLPSPSRGRISSAARSERTAATRAFGATPASAAHRSIAWPEALLAPVMTILILSVHDESPTGVRHQLRCCGLGFIQEAREINAVPDHCRRLRPEVEGSALLALRARPLSRPD